MTYRNQPLEGENKTHQLINSAIALAHAILATDALPIHKRELLSVCIWKASCAAGKYNVPYWSEGVWTLVQQHGSIDAVLKLRPNPLLHEHVNTRKALIQRMVSDPSCVERLLREEAIACLVTPEEHRRLPYSDTGFARYTAAGIRVWDVNQHGWLTET